MISSAWLSVFAKIRPFWGTSGAVREEFLWQFVAEGADHGADLVGHHDRAVDLGGGVDQVFVLRLPALFAPVWRFAFFHHTDGRQPCRLRR